MKMAIRIILSSFLFIGLAMVTQALADPPYRGHGGGHGGDYGGMHHPMAHKSMRTWESDLSAEQQKNIDRHRLDYKKEKYLLNSQMKQAKIEFALLITADSPKQASIDAKIEEIAKLKSQILRLQADYKIKVRNELTSDQRVNYDMAVLKKASKDKHKDHHGGRHRHQHRY